MCFFVLFLYTEVNCGQKYNMALKNLKFNFTQRFSISFVFLDFMQL